MRRWLELLPDQLFEVRPVLSVGYVGALMANGEFADVEVLLRGAERWLEPVSGVGEERPAPSAVMVVVDEAEFGRLPSAVALYRAAQAQINGDRERTEAFALQAFDLAARTIRSGAVGRQDSSPCRTGGAVISRPPMASGRRPWRACSRRATPSMRSVVTGRWRRSASPRVVCTRR